MGRSFRRSKRGIIGIEAAIVLIAFVIIAAAFAFMSINMGLFATQRSKDTIAQGLREASSPLQMDGNIFVRVDDDLNVTATIIPLRAMGVKYVPVGQRETVVSLSIVDPSGSSVAYANIYYGVNIGVDPKGKEFDYLVGSKPSGATDPAAFLVIENSDKDEALDTFEKGFLVITFSQPVPPRSIVTVEIRVERSAPLTVEFMVPESLTAASWMIVAG